MEKRRRILIIIVGVLLLFGLIVKGKPWLIDPLTKIDREIAEAKERLEEKALNVEAKHELRDRYLKLARRTLSLNKEEAGKELRAILARLTKSVGLDKCQIDPPSERKNLKDPTYGGTIVVVRSGVKGPGTVKQWVDFLEAFYKLPYAMQISQIAFTQNMIDRKGDITVMLTADIDVEAIVLPGSEFVPVAMVKTADLSPTSTRPASDRLKRDPAAHRMVWQKDIFTPTVAKAPVATRPAPTAVVKKGRFEPKKKQIGTTVLVGVTRWPWVDPKTGKEYLIQEVMTRNAQLNEKLIIRRGEKLDGEELIYVDSGGAVTQDNRGQLWFYPLGKPLESRVEFTDPKTAPEAWWAVQQLGYVNKDKR